MASDFSETNKLGISAHAKELTPSDLEDIIRKFNSGDYSPFENSGKDITPEMEKMAKAIEGLTINDVLANLKK